MEKYSIRYIAVSYTHLDVYKRQVINSLISVAHANDVKVNVAVGGWSYSDGRECARVFENATNTCLLYTSGYGAS